jgi:3',5'-cyclic AMP phosphodiesterase CpdA
MIRLFHVSDIHFGAEDPAALLWFERIVQAEAPDAIVFTGDLTMRARSAEFLAAGDWLKRLERPITVEPGNHDLPLLNPVARLLRPYRRYRALERMIERPLELETIAIVPLKTTARFQWRLDWSKGHVSPGSLQRTLAHIAAVPRGKRILVACHHPLVDAGTRSHGRTQGGSEALDALAAMGVEAVLTGHVHDPFDIVAHAGGRNIRLIGAGTLSERVRASRPSFNEIRVDRASLAAIPRIMA